MYRYRSCASWSDTLPPDAEKKKHLHSARAPEGENILERDGSHHNLAVALVTPRKHWHKHSKKFRASSCHGGTASTGVRRRRRSASSRNAGRRVSDNGCRTPARPQHAFPSQRQRRQHDISTSTYLLPLAFAEKELPILERLAGR